MISFIENIDHVPTNVSYFFKHFCSTKTEILKTFLQEILCVPSYQVKIIVYKVSGYLEAV